jgi:hypothetical protein
MTINSFSFTLTHSSQTANISTQVHEIKGQITITGHLKNIPTNTTHQTAALLQVLNHIIQTSSLVRNLSEHGADFLYSLVLCFRNLLVNEQDEQSQQDGEDDEHISTQSFLKWQTESRNVYSDFSAYVVVFMFTD